MADIKKIKVGNTEYNIKDSVSGYIQLTSLSGTSPISYNNSTGAISVASGYQIPTTTQVSQIGTNTSDISTINGKIPSQASTTNQLADKSFVNSSISTNTANFIGTFNSVADLEAYSGTLTNNDYAFVVETDQQGNTVYNRYKYTTATNPAEWVFEYALNNSSFTSNQWASINSGATTTNIALAESALQSGDDISELNNDAGYITTSSLNGYATQTWVGQQGYLTSTALSGYATQQWVGQQGYITGISSSDVTSALGYTPYDSSNPNGYTSNVGTVTSVNNVNPVNGNVTLSIPSSASDVGAVDLDASNLSNTGKSLISGFGMPSSRYTDLTLLASGSTYTAPANGWFYFAKIASASNQYMTIYIDNGETPIFSTTMTQALNGGQARCFLPVKKGDVVGVNYNLGGQTRRFCFVYAEGEPNV